MVYFILWAGAFYPNERMRRLEGGDWGDFDYDVVTTGASVAVPPSKPIEIDLVPDKKGTAKMAPIFVVPAFVIHKDVADVFEEAGVDNIEYYPATLYDRERGDHWEDYLVGNVLGLVDAIDMEKSVPDPDSPPRDAMLFESMVLDEQKCQGMLVFRLMHRGLIVIADAVAHRIRAKNFPFVHMVKPEDFA